MPAPAVERAYWVYACCQRCGEGLQARVDLHNDLSTVYHENDTTYFCRKVIMGGGRCYQKVELELTFDARRSLSEARIHGGKLLSREEYLALSEGVNP
ncbi:MAG: hypothetical protein L0Z70_15720 [Chloroflexi bacterium]|nr:hypothetical protein [Chloroflexota bacterium]